MAQPTFKTRSTSPDGYISFYPFTFEDTSAHTGDAANNFADIVNGRPSSGPGSKRSGGFSLNSIGADTTKVSRVFVHDEIISITTNKPKGGAGSWSAVLSSKRNFKSILHPGCWCLIYISNHQLTGKEGAQPEAGLKMLGIVKSVRCIEEVSELGARTVRYEVGGEDFHSVLNSQVYTNATLADQTAQNKAAPEVNNYTQGYIAYNAKFRRKALTPDEIVEGLIESFLGSPDPEGRSTARTGTPYLLPEKISKIFTSEKLANGDFIALMKRCFTKKLIGKTALPPGLGNQFVIWNMIQAYCHRTFNECYTELLPSSTPKGIRLLPTVVLRPIPFNSEAKKIHEKTLSILAGNHALKPSDYGDDGQQLYIGKTLEESQIIAMNYGKSDAERFNFFLVCANQAQNIPQGEAFQIQALTNAVDGVNKLSDVGSMARYGARPFIIGSNYLILDSKTILVLNEIIRDMYKRAHLFENGTVRFIGSAAHIPVGTNVKFVDRGWIAHIESVSHFFNVSSDGRKSYRSQIQFVRLQNSKTGQPLDMVENPGQRGNWDRGVTE